MQGLCKFEDTPVNRRAASTRRRPGAESTRLLLTNMDAATVVQVAEAVRREPARLRAVCPHTYPRIERAENILVAHQVCKGTSEA